MPNSEKLIAIRNKSIKKQEETLEIIENAIKNIVLLIIMNILIKC